MTPDPIESLIDQISPTQIDQIAAQLGIDPEVAGQIVSQAMPAIMAGMAGNAQRASGAQSLNSALDADHDGSILDDLAGYLGKKDSSIGGAILGHVFGAKKAAIVTQIATRLGLDETTVNAALAMLAPIVMGYLGKQRKAGEFDAGELAGLLPALDQMLGGSLGSLFGGTG